MTKDVNIADTLRSLLENFKIDYKGNPEVVINEAGLDLQERLHAELLDVVAKGSDAIGIAKVLVDPNINDILWDCLSRCTYNKERITKDLFEDHKGIDKANLYPLKIACIIKNIMPFTPVLISMLQNIQDVISK